MLLYGTNITSSGDPMHPMEPGRLFAGIIAPKEAFADKIIQLRALRTLDPVQYRTAKKQLPYFVCGLFHPPVRRKENFASISYLVMDLDHLADHEVDQKVLCEKLRIDERVMGYFLSPGGDGVKIMFRLSESCKDSALFSAFYKLFARDFARQYDLMPCLDNQTHDVTRACFLSFDPEAWYFPESIPLNIEERIPDFDFTTVEKEIRESEREMRAVADTEVRSTPDSDVLQRIKTRLNPVSRRMHEKQIHVPEEINNAFEQIQNRLPEFELSLVSSEPIQYGRKLKIQAFNSPLWAEVNIFYGRRGYSLVQTTKTGSNTKLAELACQSISQILSKAGYI